MAMLTIGEVARRADCAPPPCATTRRLASCRRPSGYSGQRRYDEAVLTRLAVIRLAQELGFSIGEIRSLVEGFADGDVPSRRWREMASRN